MTDQELADLKTTESQLWKETKAAESAHRAASTRWCVAVQRVREEEERRKYFAQFQAEQKQASPEGKTD